MISVIVPVYNAEKYIFKCLYSISQQSYSNFEVIVVNDGSKDNSEKEIKRIVCKDKRFRLISQNNQGLISARIVGIQESRGDFICFVDADDYINHDYLMKLYNAIIKYAVDMACYETYNIVSCRGIINNNFFKHKNYSESIITVSSDELIGNFCGGASSSGWSVGPHVWNKIYKCNSLQNMVDTLSEMKDIFMGEDACINLLYLNECHKVAILKDDAQYNYRYGGGSSKGNKDKVFFEKIVKMYFYRKVLLKKITNNREYYISNLYEVCNLIDYYLYYEKNKNNSYNDIFMNLKNEINNLIFNKDEQEALINKINSNTNRKSPETTIIKIKQFILNKF